MDNKRAFNDLCEKGWASRVTLGVPIISSGIARTHDTQIRNAEGPFNKKYECE